MKLLPLFLFAFVSLSAFALGETDSTSANATIATGNDPNFTIIANADKGLEFFNRKVEVFNIPIYAAPKVDDKKLLHAANVMAQYLDNDEDGLVDNLQVIDAMLANNAFLVMWNKEFDLRKIDIDDNFVGQDLGNDETIPTWHTNGHIDRFDAALEEVFHLITHAGFASTYPDVFGESTGSILANAMDTARGGKFLSIPAKYPLDAWYTYDDKTCDYSCMITEYFYWAMTSILGAQENRKDEIEQEWKLYTDALMQTTDIAAYALLTDKQYKLPTVLPDGTYRR